MGFLLISILIFNLVAIVIPKRLPKLWLYTTCLFIIVLQLSVDIVLDLKFNLYGYFTKGVDIKGFLVVFGIFPAFNVIVINYYPFKKSLRSKVSYVMLVSVFCLIFEWLSVKSGYFYYTTWKWWYSALMYPLLITIMIWDFLIVRRLSNDKTK